MKLTFSWVLKSFFGVEIHSVFQSVKASIQEKKLHNVLQIQVVQENFQVDC